jgi:hypothetical protein
MLRTIYLAAFHASSFHHEIAFDSYSFGKNVRGNEPNIVSAEVLYYAPDGSLLESLIVNHLDQITQVSRDFENSGLLMIRLRCKNIRALNIYGFLIHKSIGACVTYPTSFAVGWPETRCWDNRVFMPTGKPPKGWNHELFVANPSRWADISIKITLFLDDEQQDLIIRIPPKASRFILIEPLAEKLGLGQFVNYVKVVSRTKPITYMLGRNIKSGALSFVEHLISYHRTNFKIEAPVHQHQPDDSSQGILDSTFCYCNGARLREVLMDKHSGQVGNYCTGCRDDLRFVREIIKGGFKHEVQL